jgi:hypothetical protein
VPALPVASVFAFGLVLVGAIGSIAAVQRFVSISRALRPGHGA